ncbi:recombinase family protein [Pasteurella multocida]|uniref:recombinase family protein n=1 Tax=Pasteurella multocida TaxID=747 RepID=UPI00147B24A3|nr:recombinase family protein [Pasteurella multocida]NNH97786.1 resolvase [Pasteurella multocida]NNI42914.1 resolvase [Pasteurella multocida]
MALIGFARVSTNQQDLTEQIKALNNVGCKKIFLGKNSGKKENNSERLSKLISYIREGDVVVVTKLDRLGRSLVQVISFLEYLRENKIDFKTLDGVIDTTKRNDPISIALIHLLSLFSELERNLILSRITEGKLAKGKDGIGGRPRKISKEKLSQFRMDVLKRKSLKELSTKYGISISTAYRERKKLPNRKG